MLKIKEVRRAYDNLLSIDGKILFGNLKRVQVGIQGEFLESTL